MRGTTMYFFVYISIFNWNYGSPIASNISLT